MSNSDQTTPANNADQKGSAYDEGRKKRRLKTGQLDRDFVCMCGKAYLSYPALYTHIKNKHGGLNISAMIKKSKDGSVRQSVHSTGPIISQLPTSTQTQTQIVDIETIKPDQQVIVSINELLSFLKQVSLEPVEPCELGDIVECFGEKEEIVNAAVMWLSKTLVDNPKNQYEPNVVTSITIDQMFGKLVARLLGKVDKTIFLQFIAVLVAWRDGLNRNHLKYDPTPTYTNYCKEAPPALLLESVNDLIYQFLEDTNKLYPRSLKKLLIPRRKEFHVCKMVYLLAKWMYAENYTNLQVKFNSQD